VSNSSVKTIEAYGGDMKIALWKLLLYLGMLFIVVTFWYALGIGWALFVTGIALIAASAVEYAEVQ
jgi:hypothetical protein